MTKWMTWMKWSLVAVAVAGVFPACSQVPSSTSATVEDKTYPVTPPSVSVKTGIITGDVTEMKITERIEKGSDRVVSPAKLTGSVKLKNTSSNQTVRLVGAKIQYIDHQGQVIKLEDSRAEPTVKFSAYGSERLDPGQDVTQALDVEFPAEALKARRLKEIRFELAYIPSAFVEQTMNLTVSVGAGK